MRIGYYKVESLQWDDPASVRLRKKRERKRQEQDSRRREVEAAEKDQRLTERRKRLRLELWEGWIELGMRTVCFLCALAAMVVGSWSGELTVLGGSGATGLVGLFWMLQRSSPPGRRGLESSRSSLPTEG